MRTLSGRLFIVLLFVMIGGLAFILATIPSVAQDSDPAAFATNTPQPPPPRLPDGRIDQYALPQWLEQDLIDVMVEYVQKLTPGDEAGLLAVELLQYELESRFPDAPHRLSDREELLQMMLAAPRGMVDIRHIARPYIQTALNTLDSSALADYNGFNIEFFLIDLDGLDPVDVIVHTRYPSSAVSPSELIYEDYLLAQVDSDGVYRLLDSTPLFPAAPFADIEQIDLEQFGDLNGDGLEEMALSVQQSGNINRQLLIYGLRNGQFANQIISDEEIRFGEISQWSTDSIPPAVKVINYRLESPAWGCFSELVVQWDYSANLFRPVVTNPNIQYRNQDSLACRLYESEPYFGIPAAEAIQTIESVLEESSRDEPDSQAALDRAEMTLVMLYALQGRPSSAVDLVATLESKAEPGSWLANQADTFIQKINQAGTTAIDLCAALLAADDYGACDIDQVLEQRFADAPLERGRPVIEQLEERGLPVLETVTISALGRVDRLAVNFDLFGASWWAFAPTNPDTHTAERIDAPPGFEPVGLPLGFLDAPTSGYQALFLDNDVVAALAVMDTLIGDNPDQPPSPSARYLQALSYDLAADRRRARQAYYTLWSEYPGTIWGQLAGEHLERR
jgi:hypothetical protein